jgi:predicted  nucleic acid-binding Zn ribbon protein
LVTWIAVISATVVSRYEGTLFPVVDTSSFKIVDVAEFDKPGDWRIVTVRFDQIRHNCSLVGSEWVLMLGKSNMISQLVIPNYIYSLEKINGNTYNIQVVLRTSDVSDILHRSNIFLIHQCHNGYTWLTRTQISYNSL